MFIQQWYASQNVAIWNTLSDTTQLFTLAAIFQLLKQLQVWIFIMGLNFQFQCTFIVLNLRLLTDSTALVPSHIQFHNLLTIYLMAEWLKDYETEYGLEQAP